MSKTQNQLKKEAAIAAAEFIKPDMIVGVGTGSTINYFIEELAKIKHKIKFAVSSSKASTAHLKEIGIPVEDLNNAPEIDVYVDGADEVNQYKQMIKGGGGALTREKIISACARQFVCIVDESKKVDILGKFPLPVSVIPMSRSYVARELVKLGGQPIYREGFITDNANVILDVHNLKIKDAAGLEEKINHITGVVTNGLFAVKPANVVLVATQNGVEQY